jgi:hypothetical protein
MKKKNTYKISKNKRKIKTKKIKGGSLKEYDKVNNFHLEGENYVYLDIFARDNLVMLVCPSDINTELISVKYNNNTLLLNKKETTNPHIIILIYNIIPETKELDIDIHYNDKHKKVNIIHEDFSKVNKKTLSLTTLFKDDYYLIPMFIDYYKNQGIEHLYLYYNNKLNTLKLDNKILSNPNITFIEWDYVYRKNSEGAWSGIYHAQPSQMNHFIYKYGKPLWKYACFMDLDEYAHIKNSKTKIIDLVKSKEADNIDTIAFYNNWADTIDTKVPCENFPCIFPKEFNISSTVEGYSHRSKLINKLETISMMQNIHAMEPQNYNKTDYKLFEDKNNVIFHFFRWSAPMVDHGKRDSVPGYDKPTLYTIP